jgi:hypothetical protein
MFDRPKKDETHLDEAIDQALIEMTEYGPTSPEYPDMLAYVERLNAIKNNKRRISPDTFAIVLGNLLGIVIIVSYERMHVVTSKGMNFILKPK